MYIHTTSSFINGHLGCFCTMATANNAAMNMEMHKSFWVSVFIFFGKIPRTGITESCCSSLFNFLKNLHTVFHSDCTSLYPHQHCTRIFFSPYLHNHLLFLISLWFCGMKQIHLLCKHHHWSSSELLHTPTELYTYSNSLFLLFPATGNHHFTLSL